LTDEIKRNLINVLKAALLAGGPRERVLELRILAAERGEIALYRGSTSDGLAPILLVAVEETLPGSVERLEHEYTLKCELEADWSARPVALTHCNNRMTLVLEDSGGTPLDRLLGRPLDVSQFLHIAIPVAKALRQVHEMNRPVDSRSDLYAFGVTFYEMLTGQIPLHRRRSDGVGALSCRATRNSCVSDRFRRYRWRTLQ
jgi:hypothetical protein